MKFVGLWNFRTRCDFVVCAFFSHVIFGGNDKRSYLFWNCDILIEQMWWWQSKNLWRLSPTGVVCNAFSGVEWWENAAWVMNLDENAWEESTIMVVGWWGASSSGYFLLFDLDAFTMYACWKKSRHPVAFGLNQQAARKSKMHSSLHFSKRLWNELHHPEEKQTRGKFLLFAKQTTQIDR